jgi:hypothetical protein
VPVGGVTPDGGPAGDAFFVLAPGTYTVTATALDASGAPSRTCMSATATVVVAARQTTEVTLALACSSPGNGGLDVIVTAEHGPAITNLVFDPSKFVLACQPLTIAVTASSPDGLPLSYAWTIVSTPPNPQPGAGASALLVPSGNTAVVDTATPGDYTFTVSVRDTHPLSASLTFPVHVLANPDCTPAALPAPPAPLPAPPREKGCYFYDPNLGWQPNPCLDEDYVLSHFGRPAIPVGIRTVSYDVGIPLVFGQNQASFVAVDTVTDQFIDRGVPECPSSGTDVPNRWSIQGNTNVFVGNNGDFSGVQFTVQADGEQNGICVWNIDEMMQEYHTACTWADQRPGGLVAGDVGNVAGFVNAADHTLSVVVQLSWAKAGQPTTYTVVTDDKYGLAGHWFDYDGGVVGEGKCSNAEFTNTWLDETLAISNCPGDTEAGSGVCPPPLLEPTAVVFNSTLTGETNNLTLVGTPTAAYLNTDLAITKFTEVTGSFDTTQPAIRPVIPGGVLCPSTLVAGDREFGGNGPQISVQAATVVAGDGKSFTIIVDFDAVETGGDHSEVKGHFEAFTWNAPAGKHITSIVSGTSASVSALSKSAGGEFGVCNDGDVIANPTITGDLISAIELIGDTGGDDISSDSDCHCDTQIKSITFNDVVVQLAND